MNVIQWDMNGIYPLVNIQKTMDKSTMFTGKTQDFYDFQ